MQVISIDSLENLLYRAISQNIDLINEKASEIVHNKWQEANDLYWNLQGIDNPIARAIIALRLSSYSYEASELLERQLNKMCSSVIERKKIYGARQHTMEKKETVLATIATEAEKVCNDLIADNYKDPHGAYNHKISYLKELKKLSESNMTLRDLKLDASSDINESKQREKDVVAIIEQFRRLESNDNG